MNIESLQKFLLEKNVPKFRLKQIEEAVFRTGKEHFQEIKELPADLRLFLKNEFDSVYSFLVEKVLESENGSAAKALLKLKDGLLIETVLISPKSEIWTACISVQVGCPLKCDFCATGKMGLTRNLTTEEIADQVLFWKNYCWKNRLGKGLTNVVVMGMGEPFLNYENLKKALEIMTNNELLGLGSRRISISTAGIPEGMKKLAENFPQINLALSLHFADQEKREKYMPIAKKYDLKSLILGLKYYLKKANRKVFLEYLLLDGINDKKEDLEKLVEFVKSFSANHLLTINLIGYHQHQLSPFKSVSKQRIKKVKTFLEKQGLAVTIRKSLGEDIEGACGQLVGSGKTNFNY